MMEEQGSIDGACLYFLYLPQAHPPFSVACVVSRWFGGMIPSETVLTFSNYGTTEKGHCLGRLAFSI